MSGMQTANMDHLIRSELWSSQIKQILEDELLATKYVEWLTEFPDGDTFTIPSIGQAIVRQYAEGTPIQYDAMDTGEFQFNINEYISSATYITNKAKQDSFYMSQLVAKFGPSQARAIAEYVEEKILALSSQQTLGNANTINGVAHRLIGTNGTLTDQIALKDFAYARYALKKANVPDRNLIAIVDPSVEYVINNTANLVDVSNNPRWEGIIESGIASGMSFVKNIYGFDVYTSQRLATVTETIGGNTVTNGKANMFFSADSSVTPFVGAWRQMPTVESEYNKDEQRDEYLTIARFGLKLYRPENLVCVLTDPTAI